MRQVITICLLLGGFSISLAESTHSPQQPGATPVTPKIAKKADQKPEIELLQLKLAELELEKMPGYLFDFDQVLKINSGPLKGKTIFFAFDDPEIEGEILPPQFVVSEVKMMIDHKIVPTLEKNRNVTSVDAVSVIENLDPNLPVRILAILSVEPTKGERREITQQPFVFDLSKEGRIKENAPLNQKLAKLEPKIRTISAFKAHLSTQAK